VPPANLLSKLWEDLSWRGLIADSTRPEDLQVHLAQAPRVAYVGFDPTADSLHVGSLLPLLVLRRLQRFGHRPIVLIGGGTGLIGDPSGKTGERPLSPEERVSAWADRLRAQVRTFIDFDSAILVDNYEWLSKLQLIPFLRDVGKHFPLGAMIAKEAVRSRMGRSEEGISYTEFSYQVLQAYDFMALYERHDCTLQLGGTDQWGNITAGIELIRRVKGATVHGITLPLVTKADGTKFGKTESGTIWLDGSKTSPYEMFQFWLNSADEDVGTYLRYFTFLDQDRIRVLEAMTREHPEQREAQRVLARDVTALVHGGPAAEEAELIGRSLFGGDLESLSEPQLDQACRAMPRTAIARDELGRLPIVDLLVRTGLAASKREARDLVNAGSISMNGQRAGSQPLVSPGDVRFGRFIVLRKGKKSYHAVAVE